tara:strand:+ start:2300 stop:2578 length:279 start_codon:yes stop_codon:yes gene_type:complete
MFDENFKELMLVMINQVFEQKNEKHMVYNYVFQKLIKSKKKNKLILGKYLLSRLIRESQRIVHSAQEYVNMHTPCQKFLLNNEEKYEKVTFH